MARRRPVETEDAEKPAGKKRGRPAKARTEHKAEAPKKRGRPAKAEHKEPEKKKRGRPAKAKVEHKAEPAKKRGRPAKAHTEHKEAPVKKIGASALLGQKQRLKELEKKTRSRGSHKASEKHRKALLDRLDSLTKAKRGRRSAESKEHDAIYKKAHAKISKMSLEGHSPKSLEEHAEKIIGGAKRGRPAKVETKMGKHSSSITHKKTTTTHSSGKGRGKYVRTPAIIAKISKALEKAHREGRHGVSKGKSKSKSKSFSAKMSARREKHHAVAPVAKKRGRPRKAA